VALRIRQDGGELSGIQLKIQHLSAYALETGQIGGRRRPDDHEYDYVSY
jgi:hypothetical protein